MKAVPKVNTGGLYIEDTIVDDTFNGVVPFYMEIEPQPPADPDEAEQETDPEDEQPEETPEPEIAGYIVGVTVTPGLFMPRFDITAWEAYQDDLQEVESDYRQAYDEWQAQPEEERGEPPAYVAPEMPDLWIEGLTPEEIEEITRPQPQEPTELELLAAVVEGIQQQNTQLQEVVVSSGEELSAVKTASAEQQVTLSALGSEQVKQDLSTLDLKQQNNVIGAELVKKDISILDLYMQNQVLGQMLAALELKILANNGTGGESNV
ncbi:hypothetical protein [Paenibacillus glucanolyticus]|uniref:hypothetical protein n=1 Tax=Paenibacillus glucanolyticus TaxID=59843 RepID=UPI0018837CFE|nr:hypothetical protein [Paenibacillus glucanolyticus]